MSPRLAVPLSVVALLLAACGTDPAVDPDGPTIEAPDPDAGDPDAEAEATPDRPGLEMPQIEDDVIRAEGLVVPVPDGWTLDGSAFAQGLIGVSPGDQPPSQLLIASGAIGSDPVFGVQGLGFDEIVELFSEILPEGPALDEEVEVAGADRARLLRYDGVEVQQGQEPTDEVLLLVDAGDGRVALFNYAAPSDIFDEGVLQLLLEEAALDPGTEPTQPPGPVAPDDD